MVLSQSIFTGVHRQADDLRYPPLRLPVTADARETSSLDSRSSGHLRNIPVDSKKRGRHEGVDWCRRSRAGLREVSKCLGSAWPTTQTLAATRETVKRCDGGGRYRPLRPGYPQRIQRCANRALAGRAKHYLLQPAPCPCRILGVTSTALLARDKRRLH